MQPEAVAQFIKAVGEETNVRNGTASAAHAQLLTERATVTRKLEGLYDAIADGLRTAGLKTRLEALETRLAEIDEALSAPAPSLVRLHPNLSKLYRRKVSELADTLTDPELRTLALELFAASSRRSPFTPPPRALRWSWKARWRRWWDWHRAKQQKTRSRAGFTLVRF